MASLKNPGLLGNDDDEEFSDVEDRGLLDSLEPSGQTVEERHLWDSFINEPETAGSSSELAEMFMENGIKVLKIITYILVFSIVLGGCVLSKGIVLLMTSQLNINKTVATCGRNPSKDYVTVLSTDENVVWAWYLFFLYSVPELFALGRSIRVRIFKNVRKPYFSDVFIVFIFETLHTVGVGLLVFVVLPNLNAIKGAMLTSCFGFVPCLITMIYRNTGERSYGMKISFDFISLLLQGTGLIVWPVYEIVTGGDDSWKYLFIILTLLFLPCGWWENFVDERLAEDLKQKEQDQHADPSNTAPIEVQFNVSCFPGCSKPKNEEEVENFRLKVIDLSFFREPRQSLSVVKHRLEHSRYYIYMFIPILKMLIMFITMIITFTVKFDDVNVLFKMTEAFNDHNITIEESRRFVTSSSDLSNIDTVPVLPYDPPQILITDGLTPLYVFLTGVLTSYMAYIFGKFACKIHMQSFSFSFALNLSVPMTIISLILLCGYKYDDYNCERFSAFMPEYLFWSFDDGNLFQQYFSSDYSFVWIFWLLSSTWITLHIWSNNNSRLASTEQLFVSPMYSSIFTDQSLAYNRRRIIRSEESIKKKDEEKKDGKKKNEKTDDLGHLDDDSYYEKNYSDRVTRVYGCATMWHETADEMKEMLKSIMKVDEDQCARRLTQDYLGFIDKDYYKFQTHVMFDDAFTISKENENFMVVNDYVKAMVDTVEEAAMYVHGSTIRIRNPKKYPTPYGGRLEWTLPGKTKFIVHMKNKDKIRHKKRWSQVMYMYYILGYKLMDMNIPVDRKDVIASNTYLLALDGDIDFSPKAVLMLIDLMKKNHNLGAACGRIHPTGSGLLVWYQMFEYAVGHWMQKATEHIIGCVLCSPGCFSMFRGKALMDDNVMAKYTTKSSQARHYVQFDQGEDRWLCTLILQRGYRVEYCAASDSYTNAPEAFAEFYNQRRRWTPSTMANILDLLSNYKSIVRRNENISLPYIFYQGALMGGTILGPGTIFMMLVGSFATAFPTLDMYTAFFMNFVPIALYCAGCIIMKSDNQIRFAYLLSALYSLVMIIVLISMFVTFTEEGFNSPSAIFFIATALIFIITGILHPQEIRCLPAGMVYYLLVPSMYLLLQIYSCYNLNNVSWGTREGPVNKTKKQIEAEEKAAKEAAEKAAKARQQNSLLNFFKTDNQQNEEGSMECSLAGLFKVMCCVHKQPDDKAKVLLGLDEIKNKLEVLNKNTQQSNNGQPVRRRSSVSTRHGSNESEFDNVSDSVEEDVEPISEVMDRRGSLIDPFWIEDKDLKRGIVDYLPEAEVTFWNNMIEKYLKPLIKDKASEEKAANELKELRDTVVFTFTMMNAIFVVTIFLLQLHQDQIYIPWPLGVKSNITYVQQENEILIAKEFLKLEPIGIIFLIFFATLLGTQFTAMLFHRVATFAHILATTQLKMFSNAKKAITMDMNEENAVSIVKEVLRHNRKKEEKEKTDLSRRQTIHNLVDNQQKEPASTNLDSSFHGNFESIKEEIRRSSISTRRDSVANKRRDTFVNLIDRKEQVEKRKSIAIQRRQSMAQERRQSRVTFNEPVQYVT